MYSILNYRNTMPEFIRSIKKIENVIYRSTSDSHGIKWPTFGFYFVDDTLGQVNIEQQYSHLAGYKKSLHFIRSTEHFNPFSVLMEAILFFKFLSYSKSYKHNLNGSLQTLKMGWISVVISPKVTFFILLSYVLNYVSYLDITVRKLVSNIFCMDTSLDFIEYNDPWFKNWMLTYTFISGTIDCPGVHIHRK